MMIHGYYEIGGRNWSQVDTLGTVCDMLSKNFPNDFKVFDNSPLRNYINNTNSIYGCWNLLIKNPENGKYFLVSYMDFLDTIKADGFFGKDNDFSKCMEIFATTGCNTDRTFYQPTDIKATPISNTCSHWTEQNAIDEYYKKIKVKKYIHDKPTFFGLLYGYRHHLSSDSRFDVRSAMLGGREYVKNLYEQKMCFSLNGAEISPRDIIIMGLGNAVFRPKLICTKTHNPLIANYHYIAVDIDDIPITVHDPIKYWNEMSDRVIERYNEVKKDDDFIEFVGHNGREWYENNGTVQKAAEIIYDLLDLNKLKD